MSTDHTASAEQALPPNTELDRLAKNLHDMLSKVHHTFHTPREFVAHYTERDTDFVFDRRSGLYLAGLTGDHVDLLSAFFYYYGGTAPNKHLAADEFVRSGMGLFKSRAGHRIYRGESFVVPPELFSIQRDIEVFA